MADIRGVPDKRNFQRYNLVPPTEEDDEGHGEGEGEGVNEDSPVKP